MQQFGDNIWFMDGERIRMYRIVAYDIRMVVVRLNDGGLWLYSPIALTEERARAVEALGQVKFIIAPNKIHSLYVPVWAERFPAAEVWVSPGFPSRHPEISFKGLLGNEPLPAWQTDLDQVVVEGHRFLDEVIFFHKPSKTTIIADYLQSHDTTKDGFVMRLLKRWGGVEGPRGGTAIDIQKSFLNLDKARQSIAKVLNWPCEKVLLCHGFNVEKNGRDYLTKGFGWMFKN